MVYDLPLKAKRGMLVAFTALLLLTLVAPFTLPPGSVTDLSGEVGREDNHDIIANMNPLAAAVYLLGDLNCHQIKERSFFLNGNEMPFCARDTGIFIGLTAGMAVAIFLAPRFSWLALMVMCLPILFDGGAQLVTGYESNNLMRVLTGVLGGAGASYFLAHVANVYLSVKVPPADRSEEKGETGRHGKS